MYLDDIEKEHLKVLIKWLFDEVKSAGGDGDAFWYCQDKDIFDNLFPLIAEINKDYQFNLENNGTTIYGSRIPEESFVITNSEEEYRKFPRWAQVVIVY